MKNLTEIAESSLRANIITLPSGKYLTAGQNQFLTLWTRDFCHAVKGLMAIGAKDVAENHLSYLLRNLREDGLVPRVVDNHQVQFRVAWQTLRKQLPFVPKLSFKEPLRPQYIDEHGSNAYDSNLLVILASQQMDENFLRHHEESLKKAWHWYDDKFRDGLLWQHSFSDWQDTTNREGHTFLLNLFYFMASRAFKKIDEDYKRRIKETFFDGKVFRSHKDYPHVSVEGNLLALLDDDFLNQDEKNSLWKNLKAHPVVSLDGAIGRCSYPDWPERDLAWHIKLAKLKRYHGSLTWSWLMGLGLEAAIKMNDQEMIQKQLQHIRKLLERDKEVYEVYDPEKDFAPWGSWLIRSEHPFAWGSGYLVHALKLI